VPRLARITPDRGIFAQEPVRVPEVNRAAGRPIGFRCPHGHNFTVTFADGATLPASWECRRHSIEAGRIGVLHQPTPVAPRTHWDMLRERRPEPELAQLLDEQLRALRAGRLMPVSLWLHQRKSTEREKSHDETPRSATKQSKFVRGYPLLKRVWVAILLCAPRTSVRLSPSSVRMPTC